MERHANTAQPPAERRPPRWAWRVALLAVPALAWCGVPVASDYFRSATLARWPGTRTGVYLEQGCLVLGEMPEVPEVGDLFAPRRLSADGMPGESEIYLDSAGPRVDHRFDAVLAFSEGLEYARERGVRWVSWNGGAALAVAYDRVLWVAHLAALPLLVGAWRQRRIRGSATGG
jgi:hypothetical protein